MGAPTLRKGRGEKRFDVGVGEAVMGSGFEINLRHCYSAAASAAAIFVDFDHF